MPKRELWELRQMQSLPLEVKIQKTRQRIREWIDEFGEDDRGMCKQYGKNESIEKKFLNVMERLTIPNCRMSESRTFNHPNGYSATLYGESSMSVYFDGKEKFHTGSRNVNTEDEVMELLSEMPSFLVELGLSV